MRAARASDSMRGERRVVTILFCDVTGSTAMAGDLDPEDWAEIMHEAFNYLVAPVYRYEGTLARMMGDAILAFFGAPLAHEDDPKRAILAGLDILREIGPFCDEVRSQYGLEFNVRVGINTGPVVVGDIGSDLAMEYTAMGDTVNLASRMEQTAEPGTLQIAEATYRLVAPLFEVEPLGEIEVKGKRQPVTAYRVVAPKTQPGRLRGIEGLTSPLIGRARELEQLDQALEQVRQGRGGIAYLLGDAGLGKSRLLGELRSRWDHNWMETGGVSYDTARPYSMFQQLFRKLCGLTEQDSPAAARQRIEQLCADFEPEVEKQAARAAELILTFHADSAPAAQEGETLKRELFSSMLAAWRKPAELPLVMVFDDLHWADPASAELLQHLFQLTDEIPIFFLCALRPYRQSDGWQTKLHAETVYPHRLTQIELHPLSEDESGALIDGLLAVSELPDELRRLIMEKSEGNPFFVEELIRTLIDNGAIRRDESGLHWQATSDQLEAVSIPDNLQALLISRIDRLDKEVRRTVQLASVIGRAFYYRVLEWIAEASDRLRDDLNALQRVELIYEHARIPELEYAFKHDLTRDAAYESILRRERPKFHRQVGEAIEALFPDRLEEESHRLAYHYLEAKDQEKALKYYTLAGNMARRLSAYSEAISHYGRALELAKQIEASPAQLSFLYSRRGRIFELSGRYDEALDNYRELEQFGEQLGQPALELAAANAQATIYAIPSQKWDPELADELGQRALNLAEELGDARGEAKALWNLMLVENYAERNYEAALDYGERSLAIAREHELPEETAFALHDLARAYSQAGQPARASELLTEARQMWEELGNSEMLADNLTASAFNQVLLGNLDQGISLAERGLELSQQSGNLWGQGYSRMGLGLMRSEQGEIESAVSDFRQGIVLAEQAEFTGAGSFVHGMMAWLLAEFGQLGQADEIVNGMLEAGDERDPTLGFVVAIKAIIAHHRGNLDEARTTAHRARELLNPDSLNPEFLGYAAMLVAETLRMEGEFEQALQNVDQSLERLEQSGVRFFAPQLLLRRARALRGLGRHAEAAETLEQARAKAQEMGSRLTMTRILIEMVDLARERNQPDPPLAEAQAAVQYIADRLGDDQLRQAFLSQPRVRAITQP